MAMPDTYSQPTGTLEALQTQSAHSRRIRPPDLEMDPRDDSRVPLRAEPERGVEKEKEKLGRRESKLGLRSIFGRHKTANEVEAPYSYREAPSRGIRESLAVIGNWPYTLHGAKSEISLPTIHQSSTSRPMSTAFIPPQNPAAKAKKSVPARSKTPTPSTRGGRGSLATWDPPPLFQAYPQAIRHAQLPACTASADALLRLHGRKGSDSLETKEDPSAEKPKRRHRRNTSASSSSKLDWTTKIYVLVTSGYLLQYAGEGSFDRLPEKILHIGKDSAAFASDLIPGKHWVLQVSSAMESDGTQTSDPRSLFSRLPFRANERRQASTFLMVFESAEDMEAWITTLRREIEHLGGKKNLSETGKPKLDDNVVQLRAQPSQRTLVVRDPERFSRVITQELPWNQDTALAAPDIQLDTPESDSMPDPESLDDVSATNSVVSQDGRQLDNLRDSANRLSFISSGQRTFVTSEGSSPPCSPARDSFASQLTDETPYAEIPPDARPRPNAAAILDRRQSMQTINPFVEFRIAQTAPPRPLSVYSTSSWQDGPQSPPTIPNFSVPHSVGRRYSLAKSPPPEFAALASPPPGATARIPPARGARRPPPPSLGFSRPLSIVKDQPSPGPTTSPGFSDHFGAARDEPTTPGADATITPAAFASMDRPVSGASQNDYDLPSRNSSLVQVTIHTSPKRHNSMQTLRSPEDGSDPHTEVRRFILPNQVPMPSIPLDAIPGYDGNSRSKSSLDSYGRTRSRSPRRNSREALLKRSSMFMQPSEALVHRSWTGSDTRAAAFDPQEFLATLRNADSTKTSGPLLPRPSASNQHLRVHSNPKSLLNRRSMPQLVDGPPPAPPPTCALPPLPGKLPAPKSRARAINI